MCEFLCGSVIPVQLVSLNTDSGVFSSPTEKKSGAVTSSA